MREYALFEARSRQAYGAWTGSVHVVRNWKTRRDLKRLLAMDDFMLRDIGLTRAVVLKLARRPLAEDWQCDAERRDFKA
jgi:uncharacterized protein YjiS (DUF1127 family)